MLQTIECVECAACGKLHRKDGDSFFAFHGNVTIGLMNGLIGNNLTSTGTVMNISICCRSTMCLHKLMGQHVKEGSATLFPGLLER